MISISFLLFICGIVAQYFNPKSFYEKMNGESNITKQENNDMMRYIKLHGKALIWINGIFIGFVEMYL